MKIHKLEPLISIHQTGANFGLLDKPGEVLGNSTRVLEPGDSFVFRVKSSVTRGIVDFHATPEDAVTVEVFDIETPGALGAAREVEFKITMNADAPNGTVVTLKSQPTWQSRKDPNYAFSFVVANL